MNPDGGPTTDKPGITLTPNRHMERQRTAVNPIMTAWQCAGWARGAVKSVGCRAPPSTAEHRSHYRTRFSSRGVVGQDGVRPRTPAHVEEILREESIGE
jgi:hypothetical protein